MIPDPALPLTTHPYPSESPEHHGGYVPQLLQVLLQRRPQFNNDRLQLGVERFNSRGTELADSISEIRFQEQFPRSGNGEI